MANDDLDFAEKETNPDIGAVNRRRDEEKAKEPPNSDSLLDVVPISDKYKGDPDKLRELLNLIPVGGKKKETTEDITEDTMQVEMPKRMYQVADDGTIIGSKITKNKAEKLIGGEATFDGKVLQLNRPPTDKEKEMASSKWDSEKGQSVPIQVVDDLVQDEKVDPPEEEQTPGDLDNPDLGPEGNETIGDMMEMPDILDKPVDEPDKPEDFPMIFASNADKYWRMYMQEAEDGSLAAAKHLKNMLDEDLADALGENYDDLLDDLNDLIQHNEPGEPVRGEKELLGEEGYARKYATGEDREPDLRRYKKPDEWGTHYDFDELESEPPALSPEELIGAISYARKLGHGKGKSRKEPDTYVYWNDKGEAVGMRAVDHQNSRMLNVGATHLPGMSKPMNDYDSMYSEGEEVSPEKQQQFKDESRQLLSEQKYRVTQIDANKIADAVQAIGPVAGSSGKGKYRTFEGPSFDTLDDVPGLEETDKYGNELKRGIYNASLQRALDRKYGDSPKKITTPSMFPDPTATNEAGELIHPFNPEGHTDMSTGSKLPQYDFSTRTGDGMSGLPRKKQPGLPYSVINAMKERGFKPPYSSARPSDSETRIMFGQGQGTPKSGKLVPGMKGEFSFTDIQPREDRLPGHNFRDNVGLRTPVPHEDSTLHETNTKDLKALLGGNKGNRKIGNQSFNAELLAALSDWPTKDMTVRYPGENMPEGVGPMSASGSLREGIPISMNFAPQSPLQDDAREMLKSENPNDNYSLLPSSFFDQGSEAKSQSQDNMSLLPAGWGEDK